jgi:hypothetical protein
MWIFDAFLDAELTQEMTSEVVQLDRHRSPSQAVTAEAALIVLARRKAAAENIGFHAALGQVSAAHPRLTDAFKAAAGLSGNGR